MPKKDELPQDLTDRIATEENTADREAILGPIKRGAKKLYENVMGTPEQNAIGQATLDKQAREGSGLAKALGGRGMKSGGSVKSASARADGCAIRGKTRA